MIVKTSPINRLQHYTELNTALLPPPGSRSWLLWSASVKGQGRRSVQIQIMRMRCVLTLASAELRSDQPAVVNLLLTDTEL